MNKLNGVHYIIIILKSGFPWPRLFNRGRFCLVCLVFFSFLAEMHFLVHFFFDGVLKHGLVLNSLKKSPSSYRFWLFCFKSELLTTCFTKPRPDMFLGQTRALWLTPPHVTSVWWHAWDKPAIHTSLFLSGSRWSSLWIIDASRCTLYILYGSFTDLRVLKDSVDWNWT